MLSPHRIAHGLLTLLAGLLALWTAAPFAPAQDAPPREAGPRAGRRPFAGRTRAMTPEEIRQLERTLLPPSARPPDAGDEEPVAPGATPSSRASGRSGGRVRPAATPLVSAAQVRSAGEQLSMLEEAMHALTGSGLGDEKLSLKVDYGPGRIPRVTGQISLRCEAPSLEPLVRGLREAASKVPEARLSSLSVVARRMKGGDEAELRTAWSIEAALLIGRQGGGLPLGELIDRLGKAASAAELRLDSMTWKTRGRSLDLQVAGTMDARGTGDDGLLEALGGALSSLERLIVPVEVRSQRVREPGGGSTRKVALSFRVQPAEDVEVPDVQPR